MISPRLYGGPRRMFNRVRRSIADFRLTLANRQHTPLCHLDIEEPRHPALAPRRQWRERVCDYTTYSLVMIRSDSIPLMHAGNQNVPATFPKRGASMRLRLGHALENAQRRSLNLRRHKGLSAMTNFFVLNFPQKGHLAPAWSVS